MLGTTFSASATLEGSISISDVDFSVTAKVVDKSGNYSGNDVEVGDYLFVDITNNRVNNAEVARYEIKSIVAKTVESVSAIVQFAGTGDLPDPLDYLYQPAFLCRKVLGGSSWIASHTVQNLPEYLTAYARNIDTSAASRRLKSHVEYRTLSQVEADNKKLVLANLPKSAVSMQVYRGAPAWLDEDFSVNGSEITWEGLGLDGLISEGDRLILTYNIVDMG